MTKLATLTEMTERTVSEILKNVGTSIPGHILSVNGQVVTVQVGVQFADRFGGFEDVAPIVNAHVHFPGGDYCVEYQLDEGAEGIILFSQRCIDAWKEQGGVSAPPIIRKHDMQDAVFIPGLRSKPNALKSFSNNGVRLRNKDGSQYFWLKNDGSIEGKCTDFNMISDTFTHNGVNVGEDHQHDDSGTYNVSGNAVTGTSGEPV